MEKIKIITTKETFMFLPISDGANKIQVHGFNKTNNILYYKNDGYAINLKFDSDIEFICLLSQAKEEDAKKIVDNDGDMYLQYNDFSSKPYFDNAIESLKSLMESENIYTVNPFGEMCPKEKTLDLQTQYPINYYDIKQWQGAQQRTSKEWLIIKLKKK